MRGRPPAYPVPNREIPGPAIATAEPAMQLPGLGGTPAPRHDFPWAFAYLGRGSDAKLSDLPLKAVAQVRQGGVPVSGWRADMKHREARQDFTAGTEPWRRCGCCSSICPLRFGRRRSDACFSAEQ